MPNRQKGQAVQLAIQRPGLWAIIKETATAWSEDNASRLAAALAFYTLLSIAPMIVLAVFVAGLAYGEEAARGQVAAELSNIVGPQAAQGIQSLVENASTPDTGVLGSVLGLVVLIFGASSVFAELRTALNQIWDVDAKKSEGIRQFLGQHFFSFLIVMGVAILLLASTLFSAALSALGRVGERALPGGEMLWQALNFAISFGMVSVLFAMTFKYLPDIEIAWRNVWIGAAVTALFFVIGKSLIGLYLGKSSISSSYGAAGSVVVFVIWVYYSSQILFFGAELTQVIARHRAVAPAAKMPIESPA